MTRPRFSLKHFLLAVTAICIAVGLARWYYVANTRYELRAEVDLDFASFRYRNLFTKTHDNDALSARINVSGHGKNLLYRGELFGVVGREGLRCTTNEQGVVYFQSCRSEAELVRAQAALFDEIDALLQRNHDLFCYGYQVTVTTYRPFGNATTQELHNTLRPRKFGLSPYSEPRVETKNRAND